MLVHLVHIVHTYLLHSLWYTLSFCRLCVVPLSDLQGYIFPRVSPVTVSLELISFQRSIQFYSCTQELPVCTGTSGVPSPVRVLGFILFVVLISAVVSLFTPL